MEKWKAKRDFAAADDLFQRKRYNEALEVLNRLNREFPNNRRVMMPRALCLAEMGRYHEAATVCEKILAEEEYPRAQRLLNKLQPMLKAEYVPVYEPLGVFDRIETGEGAAEGTSAFGDEPPTYMPPVDRGGGGGWGRPILITFVVLLMAGAIGGAGFYYVVHQKYGETEVAQAEAPVEPLPVEPAPVEEAFEPYEPDFSQYNKYADPASVAIVQQQMAQEQQQQQQAPAPFPGGRRELGPENEASWNEEDADDAAAVDYEEVDISEEGLLGLGVGLLAILFVVGVVLEFVVLFCTLLLLNKMPRPTLGENLLLIAGVSVASILIAQIPYVGKFAALFMIITVFQLSFVDCLVMILINVVVFVCAAFVFVGLIGISLGAFL